MHPRKFVEDTDSLILRSKSPMMDIRHEYN